MFAQCLSVTTGSLHLFKVLIDSGAPVDVRNTTPNMSTAFLYRIDPCQVRNNAGLTALDLTDNAEIRAVLIDAYSRQRSSGQLKFSTSSSFKTPKQITLDIRALAQANTRTARPLPRLNVAPQTPSNQRNCNPV